MLRLRRSLSPLLSELPRKKMIKKTTRGKNRAKKVTDKKALKE